MSPRASLEQRRLALLARSQQQRQVLAAECAQLQHAADVIDRGLGMFARLRKKPVWIAAAAATLIVIRSGRVLSLLKTGLFAWQTFGLIQSVRKRIGGQHSDSLDDR
jgi:hypothetical protein